MTVVTNARVYYTPRAAAGAPGARHSLRPQERAEVDSITRALGVAIIHSSCPDLIRAFIVRNFLKMRDCLVKPGNDGLCGCLKFELVERPLVVITRESG